MWWHAIGKNWPFGQEDWFFAKKKQKKTAIFLCTNLGYLTLEGPELQAYPRKVVGLTVQTSYVEGWWYQNWAPTIQQHFFMCVHGNWRESEFFGKTLRTWKFSMGNFFGASIYGILRHSWFRKYSWFGWPSLRFEVVAAQSEVKGKNRSCYEKSIFLWSLWNE